MATSQITAGNDTILTRAGAINYRPSPPANYRCSGSAFGSSCCFSPAASTLFAALASSHGVNNCSCCCWPRWWWPRTFLPPLSAAACDRGPTGSRISRPSIGCRSRRSPRPRSDWRVAAVRSQPRSPWHARGATALPWLRRFVIAAIAMACTAGAACLAATIGYRTSLAGVLVGGLSAAVLCGWITFLCGSFYGVFRHGFREALAEQQKDMLR